MLRRHSLWGLLLGGLALGAVACEPAPNDDDDSQTATATEAATATQPSGTSTQPPETATATAAATPTEPEPSSPTPTDRPATPTQAHVTPTPGGSGLTGDVTVQLPGVTRVDAINNWGNLSLVAGSRAPVANVTWNVQLSGAAAPSLVEALTVSAVVESGGLNVVAMVPEGLEGNIAAFDVTVQVPPSLIYAVTCEGGDTSVQGMSSGGAVVSGQGAVSGARLSGSPLSVQSQGGVVDVQTAVEGDDQVTIAAEAGAVTLRVPSDTKASVSGHADGGQVRFANLAFDGTNQQGQASGSLNGGGDASLSVTTVGANILFVGTASVPGPTPTPGETPPPGPTPTPGDTPLPGETPTPGPTGTPEPGVPYPGGAQPVPVSSATGVMVYNPYGLTTINGLNEAPTVSAGWVAVLTGDPKPSLTSQIDVVISREGATLSVTPFIPEALLGQLESFRMTVNGPGALAWAADVVSDIVIYNSTTSTLINSTSGAVGAIGLAGSVGITSGPGLVNITVDLAAGDEVNVATTSGPISLSVPVDTKASVSASTASGEVIFTGLTFSGVNADGHASGTIGGGDVASIDLSTGEGDIELDVKP